MTVTHSSGRSKLLIVAALFLAAGVAVILYGRLGSTIVSMVERHGESVTGTPVRLRSADVSLTSSRGTLSDLVIGNPDGYETDYALRVEEIELQVDLRSVAGNPLIVNEILVDGATLNAEQRGGSSNLTDILEHMEQEDEGAAEDSEALIVIDRFRLSNGRISLTSDLLEREQHIDLSAVVVEGVGRESGGVTYDQAAAALLDPVLSAARSAVRQRLRDAAGEELEDAAEERVRDLLQRE